MWERKFFYVFKVWSEVSPQAKLCLPSEEEAQDRAGDGGSVRQFWAGSVPGQERGRGGSVSLSPRQWPLRDLWHTPAPLPPNIINIASSNIFKLDFQNYRKFR